MVQPVMDSSLHSEFQDALDESAGEVGERIADDLPSGPSEIRSALPADQDDLPGAADGSEGSSVPSALADSPIAAYFE